MADTVSSESQQIKTDLSGPITSISAVANNTNGEWDRLVGAKVHQFENQDITNLLVHCADSLGIQPRQNAVAIFDELKKEIYEPGSSRLSPEQKEIFSNQLAESLKATRPELYADMMKNSSVMRPLDERHAQVAQGIVAMSLAANKNIVSAINTPQAKILILPSDMSKEEWAAKALNVPVEDIPAGSVPGTAEQWKAAYILHELEHLTEQLPEKGANKLYHDTLNELDSDMAMHSLLTGKDNAEFLEYQKQTRIINAIATSVNIGAEKGLSHYTYGVLDNPEAFQKGEYSVAQGKADAASLIEKIRDELGIDGKADMSLKDVAQAVQSLLDGTSKTHEAAEKLADGEHEVDVQVLTPEEREVAENFLEALQKTGFTQKWEADAKTQASVSLDQAGVEQSLKI